MKLHENPRLFEQAIRATAEEKGLPEIYIEKDYWVTLALKLIFEQEPGQFSVFKGGTALSKCYGMIERFSEDIDIVLLREEKETSNQKTKKIKAIGEAVGQFLPEEYLEGVTRKKGTIRKTAHTYPKAFAGTYGQVRDKIIVEATWLGHYEPYSKQDICSYLYEMMIQRGQEELIEEYELHPFEVLALQPKRTFCEKIMSLVRFSYGEFPVTNLKLKIRHIYDLHQMLKQEELGAFFNTDEFEALLKKVAEGDVRSFKNNNDWLRHHPQDAKLFAEMEAVGEELRKTYEQDFRGLVYGELPPWGSVMGSLEKIRDKISRMNWIN